MLGSMDEYDVIALVDLVDDAELPASRRVQTLELTPQRLACPVRVLRDGPQDRLDDRGTHLRRKPVEVPEAFRRDLDLVHGLEVVLQADALAFGRFPT